MKTELEKLLIKATLAYEQSCSDLVPWVDVLNELKHHLDLEKIHNEHMNSELLKKFEECYVKGFLDGQKLKK